MYFSRKILHWFLNGITLVFPLLLTILLVIYPLSLLNGWLSFGSGTFFHFFLTDAECTQEGHAFFIWISRYFPESTIEWINRFLRWIPYANIFAVLMGVTLLGVAASTFWVRSTFQLVDYIIQRIPGLNFLYSYAKESTAAFIGKFNQPVFVMVNRELNMHKIGFVTQEDLRLFPTTEGMIGVYLPHSYSFSGELVFFNKKDVHPMKLSPSQAWKIIASGGVVHPQIMK